MLALNHGGLVFSGSPSRLPHQQIRREALEDERWEVRFAHEHALTSQELQTLPTPANTLLVSSRQSGYGKVELLDICSRLNTNILLSVHDIIQVLQARVSHKMRVLSLQYCLEKNMSLLDGDGVGLLQYVGFQGTDILQFLDSLSYTAFLHQQEDVEEWGDEEDVEDDVGEEEAANQEHSDAVEQEVTPAELQTMQQNATVEFFQVSVQEDPTLWYEKLVFCAELSVLVSSQAHLHPQAMHRLMRSFQESDLRTARLESAHVFGRLFNVMGDSKTVLSAYSGGQKLQEELLVHMKTYERLHQTASFLDDRVSLLQKLISRCDSEDQVYKEFRPLIDVEAGHLFRVFGRLKKLKDKRVRKAAAKERLTGEATARKRLSEEEAGPETVKKQLFKEA